MPWIKPRVTSLRECFRQLPYTKLYKGASFIEPPVLDSPLHSSVLVGRTAAIMGRSYDQASIRDAAAKAYLRERRENAVAVEAWTKATQRGA